MNLQKYNLKDYNSVSFIDTEITIESKKIKDFGAVRMDGAILHTGAPREFFTFIADSKYVCGHYRNTGSKSSKDYKVGCRLHCD